MTSMKIRLARLGIVVLMPPLLLGGARDSQAANPPPTAGSRTIPAASSCDPVADWPLFCGDAESPDPVDATASFTTTATSLAGAWQFASSNSASTDFALHIGILNPHSLDLGGGLLVDTAGPGIVARASGPGGIGVWGKGATDLPAGAALSLYQAVPKLMGPNAPAPKALNRDLKAPPRPRTSNTPNAPATFYWGLPAGVQARTWSGSGVRGIAPAYGGFFQGGTGAPGYKLNTVDGVFAFGEVGVEGVSDGNATSYGGLFISALDIGMLAQSESSAGLWGWSKNGPGVRAKSTTNYGVYATTNGGGVAAVAGAGPDTGGIFTATLGSGVGLAGRADGDGGIGVRGTTTSSSSGSYGGVFEANSGTGVAGTSQQGTGLSGSSMLGSEGVYGSSSSGTGVYGSSLKGIGVAGSSTTGIGVWASSPYNYGLTATSSSGTGLMAWTDSGPAGLWAHTSKVGGTAIQADGNMYVDGHLYTSGGQYILVPTNQGMRLEYGRRATQPTVTDRGTAQLQHGRAEVRFDALYTQVADLGIAYQVFVSPVDAVTGGLAVVKQTPTGFEVLELGGGTGSFRFDWQVEAVSKPPVSKR